MSFLTLAVIVLSALCAFNLILTLGVVRRIRSMKDEHLGELALAPGSFAPDFKVVTNRGLVVSRAELDGGMVLGFFSPSCGACKRQIPKFVSAAQENATSGYLFLSVVHGSEEDTRAQAADLEVAGPVVIEDVTGSLGTAFSVSGYPAFLVLDSAGRVSSTSIDVEKLSFPRVE